MPISPVLLLYFITIAAGGSLAAQQVVNANLRSQLGSPWWAGFVSYFVGMVAMFTVATTVDGFRSPSAIVSRIHDMSWVGGLLGAFFIATGIFMIPRLGSATTVAFVVVGQLTASVLIDHFALLGVQQHSLSLTRLAGVGLLVAGVILVRR